MTSPYLDQPTRTEAQVQFAVSDARIADAVALIPALTTILASAKAQADKFGRTERRFGSEENMHLARLLDDLWMACDNFISDVPDMARRQRMTRGR